MTTRQRRLLKLLSNDSEGPIPSYLCKSIQPLIDMGAAVCEEDGDGQTIVGLTRKGKRLAKQAKEQT